MKKKTIEKLLEQAVSEGIIEIQCPKCGAIITSEPDAEELFCQECERATMKNPLVELGLIYRASLRKSLLLKALGDLS